MIAGYVDTSFLLAILLREPRAASLQRVLTKVDSLVSGDLLIAETLSALRRERVPLDPVASPLRGVSFVFPDRSLRVEMESVLEHGYLRGADLWHLACALYVAGEARTDLAFLSRDEAQRAAARGLGFPTP